MVIYELSVIWDTGKKEKHLYKTFQEAENIKCGYLVAFGKQIQYTNIRAFHRDSKTGADLPTSCVW